MTIWNDRVAKAVESWKRWSQLPLGHRMDRVFKEAGVRDLVVEVERLTRELDASQSALTRLAVEELDGVVDLIARVKSERDEALRLNADWRKEAEAHQQIRLAAEARVARLEATMLAAADTCESEDIAEEEAVVFASQILRAALASDSEGGEALCGCGHVHTVGSACLYCSCWGWTRPGSEGGEGA